MHLHPDAVFQLAQLERARAAGKPEMPMVATGMTRQLALTSNDEATLTAFGQSLGRRDVQVQFEHDSGIRRCIEPGKPLNPGFLIGRLHSLLPVCRAYPRNSLRRRDACENGHAGERRARSAAPSQATDLHELASPCSKKRIDDLARRDVRLGGQAEIRPGDHVSRPGRRPARVQIETEGSLGVVRTPVGERRRPYARAVGKRDDRHRRSLRFRALPAVAQT